MATETADGHLPEPAPALLPGALTGVASYLAGYLVVYLWQADRVAGSLAGPNAVLDLLGGDAVPVWKVVGWLFFDAHFVALTVPLPGRGRVSRGLVGGDGASALLYLVPLIALLAGGYLAARYADAPTPAAGARSGATLAPGYVLAAIVGLFAFRATVAGVVVAPDLATGALLAGLAYPTVVGAAGGALAAVTR